MEMILLPSNAIQLYAGRLNKKGRIITLTAIVDIIRHKRVKLFLQLSGQFAVEIILSMFDYRMIVTIGFYLNSVIFFIKRCCNFMKNMLKFRRK